ncbi:MAG: hypothetical protein AAF989_04660 [Planctomycetota bacterium]
MSQLHGLWRDTWWLWGLFVGMIVLLATLTSWFLLFLVCALPVSFAYFAFVRYDEDGNDKLS